MKQVNLREFLYLTEFKLNQKLPLYTNLKIRKEMQELNKVKSDKYIFEGTVNYGTPQVTSHSNSKATVEVCGVDSGWYLDSVTGNAALGTGKGSAMFFEKSNMNYVNGSWKESESQITEPIATCPMTQTNGSTSNDN